MCVLCVSVVNVLSIKCCIKCLYIIRAFNPLYRKIEKKKSKRKDRKRKRKTGKKRQEKKRKTGKNQTGTRNNNRTGYRQNAIINKCN